MKNTPYQKEVKPFYLHLLSKVEKIQIYTVSEKNKPRNHYQQISYLPTKKGIRIYTSTFIKLSHELAHILEVKNHSRLHKIDFGMSHHFPKTTKGQLQAIARESRVRGIQNKLMEITGSENKGHYKNIHNLLRSLEGTKFKNNQDVIDWSASITSSAFNSWCEDRVVAEFQTKADSLNEWLNNSDHSMEDVKHRIKQYRSDYRGLEII